ncbi:MAG: hypothetical protein AAFN77_09255 [Planctomycetota bacterium]
MTSSKDGGVEPQLASLKARSIRFGIRSLLVLVLLIACVFGYWNFRYAPIARAFDDLGVDMEDVFFYDADEIDELNIEPLSKFEKWVYKISGIRTDPRTVSDIFVTGPNPKLSALRHFENLSWLDIADVDDVSQLPPLKRLTYLDILTSDTDISSLSKLVNLQTLIIDAPNLEDVSPLKSLAALDHLEICQSKINSLAPLKHLTQLRLLRCKDCDVRDLQPLAGLKQLKYLFISRTQTVDLSALSELDSLSHLDVSYTNVVDLSPLSELDSLSYLDVSDSNVVDLSPLSGLDSLSRLDVSYSKVVDLDPISNLKLRSLYIRGTGVTSLEPLRQMIALRHLALKDSKVTTLRGTENMSFSFLELENTKIRSLEPLKRQDKLTNLSLVETDVESLASLPDMPRLDSLKVGGTRLRSLEGLDRFSNLRSLSIDNGELYDGTHLNDLFESLPFLRDLMIRNADLGDLRFLSSCSRLESLRLYNCRISDFSTISTIGQLRDLFKLHITDCELKDVGFLKRSSRLRSVKFTGTQIESLQPLLSSGADLQSIRINRTPFRSLAGLERLQNLELLHVSDTLVTDLSPIRRLNILNLQLARLQLSPADMQDIVSIKGLYALDISHTGLKDFASLSKCPKLQVLVVDGLSPDLDQLQNLADSGCRIVVERDDQDRDAAKLTYGTGGVF